MSFDLKNLGLFVRVAALGAIGKAGAEFNLSATNASQRIQQLEADLGVKLLNRTTRSVSLTPDGEILLDHAKRILDDAEAVKALLSEHASSVTGRLRVTASASFGRSHIIPFVPEFLAQYPNVTLDLNFTDAIVDIVEEGYDLAFRSAELEPSSLLVQKIDDNPRILVASKDYIEKKGMPHSPQDLQDHICLWLNSIHIWRLKGPDGQEYEVHTSSPVNVNLGDAVGQWASAGMGIALASLWHVGDKLRDGSMVAVLPDYKIIPESKIWAVRPPGRLMHTRTKAFIDFMKSRIIAVNHQRYGDLVDIIP